MSGEETAGRRNPPGGRVLGLDPGSRRLGYGLLERTEGGWRHLSSGTLNLDTRRPLADRLLQVHRFLCELLEESQPRLVVIEECFVAQSARAALVLGEVRGVLILAVKQAGLELAEYSPRSVKLASVGNGGASKEQVQYMMPRILEGCPRDLKADQADALAVAWCGVTHAMVPDAEGKEARRGSGGGLRR